jgi:dephospho-CoA kinase
MAKKIIIGITGEIGSGKDTFCEYVKKNYPNVFTVRFSDPLKDILKMFFEDIKREDQQWLGSALKEKFGGDILIKALARKINTIETGLIILNGVRAQGEAKTIKDIGGKILYVTAAQLTRWERVRTREEKADDNVPFGKFQEMEIASAELPIPSIGQAADFKIDNNGTKEEFYEKIKKLIDKIYKYK